MVEVSESTTLTEFLLNLRHAVFHVHIPHDRFNQFSVVRHFMLFIIIHYYNQAYNEYPCKPTTQLKEAEVARLEKRQHLWKYSDSPGKNCIYNSSFCAYS